jgi:hypothetical protein
MWKVLYKCKLCAGIFMGVEFITVNNNGKIEYSPYLWTQCNCRESINHQRYNTSVQSHMVLWEHGAEKYKLAWKFKRGCSEEMKGD